jgi:hypothetical protein
MKRLDEAVERLGNAPRVMQPAATNIKTVDGADLTLILRALALYRAEVLAWRAIEKSTQGSNSMRWCEPDGAMARARAATEAFERSESIEREDK